MSPSSSGGLAELDRALARLSNHRRLLVIAAHPDDEDTRLLTYTARGLGGEAAYLSLSRGEGGQNLIGPELGVALGLLRSRELQAARDIDGARQYFTRAYDFGYTRSLDETLQRWPQAILLEDTVRVIRRFKPQVVVAVFPPTARAGHGQHWASGIIAQESFQVAADGEAFPELGLPPWQSKTFYRAAFFDRAAATLEYPLSDLDPWTGKSIFQISMQSRSQHRCQDMGLLQPLGDTSGALTWQEGGEGDQAQDIFAGVDTRLSAIASLLSGETLRTSVETRLRRVEEIVSNARQRLSAVAPFQTGESLAEVVKILDSIQDDLADQPGSRHAKDLIQEKLKISQEALAIAAGLLADSYTEFETVVPGQAFKVRTNFWNAGPLEVSDLKVSLVGAGWNEIAREKPDDRRQFFSTSLDDELELSVEVPRDANASIPYFLESDLQGDLYDWSAVPEDLRGLPFAPAPLFARFEATVAGAPWTLDREIVFRQRDQAFGEIRKPLRVVPKLEVAVQPALVVRPTDDDEPVRLRLQVVSNAQAETNAVVIIKTPPGWPEVEPHQMTLKPKDRQSLDIALQVPADIKTGQSKIEFYVENDGQSFHHSYPVVSYEHIRPTPRPVKASIDLSAVDLKLPALQRIGYIRGAADQVPELLAAVGAPVEVLSGEDLAEKDLSGFSTIVVGSRAYETDATLGKLNGRLLDYARQGGTLIVQYQQYQFARGGFAPFELEIRRPHDRVTDETAPVRVLEPNHPVLTSPNQISAADWQGWIQERGLYFAGTWDDAFKPLLSMADPDGDEKRGSLIIAKLGEGHYVYTGLAFFRQLPAGVPGAYRLFANLLALGQEKAGQEN